MTDMLPPILVSRRARENDAQWREAPSWFGGLPRLGRQPWPRSQTTGKPLIFAAQIDLAELAAAHRNPALPADGALAFFLDAEGAVVHVPAGADRTPTRPPEDASPAYEPHGDLFPQNPSPWARIKFPYWPVEFTALDVGPVAHDPDDESGEALYAAMAEAVGRRMERRQYFLGSKQAFETLGGGATPFWWHYAHSYAEHLQIARFHSGVIEKARQPFLEKARAEVQRLTPKTRPGVFGKKTVSPDEALAKALKYLATLETQDADYRRQLSGFGGFIAEAEAFAAGRDPWTRIDASETTRFQNLFERGRTEFSEVTRFRTPHRMEDIATATLLAMATGERSAFDAMPDPIRDLINTRYRLPSQSWHQMFGLGVDIQGNAAVENEGRHMLLQLVYDDMVNWNFGDMGAFQFWITPKDLAGRNWSAVTQSFECH